MRIDKYELILRVGITLGIASILVIFYYVFNNAAFVDTSKNNIPSINFTQTLKERDSLAKIFSTTSKEIDNTLLEMNNLNNDTDAENKLTEMSKLRLEISDLLNATSPNADLKLAKLKMEELQIKVALLQTRYSGMEAENKRLQNMLNQLLVENKSYKNNTNTDNTNKTPVVKEQKISTGSTERSISSITTAAGLQLQAVMLNNTKELETNDSGQAEKMIGSFFFKTTANKTTNEVIVVVLQPDGKVVKNSVWESGTFETREGKKVYTKKVLVEPSNDEKMISFSLTPDTFISGDYIMQIWYNGNLIAKTLTSLI